PHRRRLAHPLLDLHPRLPRAQRTPGRDVTPQRIPAHGVSGTGRGTGHGQATPDRARSTMIAVTASPASTPLAHRLCRVGRLHDSPPPRLPRSTVHPPDHRDQLLPPPSASSRAPLTSSATARPLGPTMRPAA